MKKIIIERENEKDLQFEGKLIASATTQREDSLLEFYHDYVLYKTSGGAYVLVVSYFRPEGRPEVTVSTCRCVEHVVNELSYETEDGYKLHKVGKRLLKGAAELDPAFKDSWIEELA